MPLSYLYSLKGDSSKTWRSSSFSLPVGSNLLQEGFRNQLHPEVFCCGFAEVTRAVWDPHCPVSYSSFALNFGEDRVVMSLGSGAGCGGEARVWELILPLTVCVTLDKLLLDLSELWFLICQVSITTHTRSGCCANTLWYWQINSQYQVLAMCQALF